MRTRFKLLMAGAILTLATFSTAPAHAWCRVMPIDGIWSEEECESYCWDGGCYNYSWDGSSGCFCS